MPDLELCRRQHTHLLPDALQENHTWTAVDFEPFLLERIFDITPAEYVIPFPGVVFQKAPLLQPPQHGTTSGE